MATESPIRITETSGTWASLKGTSTFGSSSANMAIEELGLLLTSQTFQGNGRDSVPNRSGSAPPSMEGSFTAAKSILPGQNFTLNADLASTNSAVNSYVSEDPLRADPAHVAYSSNANLNPRLTPPLISRENRRLARRIGSARNDRRLTSSDDSGHGSLLMLHGKLPTHKEEHEEDKSAQQTPTNEAERSNSFWSPQKASSSSQVKSIVDMIQEDFPRTQSPVYTQSQAPSLILESVEEAVSRNGDSSPLHDPTQTSNSDPIASVSSSSFPPSTRNTLSKTALYRRHSNTVEAHSGDDDISTSGVTGPVLIINSISTSSSPNPKAQQHIQEQVSHQQSYTFEVESAHQSQLPYHQGINRGYIIGSNQLFHGPSDFSGAEVQPVAGFRPPLYANAAASTLHYPPNLHHPPGYISPQYTTTTVGGYAFQPEAISPYHVAAGAGYVPHTAVVPLPSFNTAAAAARPNFSPPQTSTTGGMMTSHGGVNNMQQHLMNNYYYGQLGFSLQPSSYATDPLHMQQYFQQPFIDAAYGLPGGQFDHLAPRPAAAGTHIRSALDSHKGVSEFSTVFSSDQKLPHQGSIGPHTYMMNPGRVGGMPYFVGSPRDMGILQFPTSAIASPVLPGSPVGGATFFGGTNDMRFPPPSLARNSAISSGWQGQRGIDDTKAFSFLEELKSGKSRRFELSDIAGHIIEFSGDQHGSRFIQQKLENCSVEEKASVFKEVLPNTSKLMTDVFGNYVIQKFFEYGSMEQRKELANQLAGQILPLSLQMYGCRVIQKALEVIELEQKIKLVRELDGHVIRCVRDQNGNHVVQKCIETIPTNQIEFIISSFRAQVATLSMHPYGCRVIQRVLEHCTDDLQSQFIVDEILESVCALAQDQYGNYVTQHVLERGKPEERSQIIGKLSGHIVQLSQHKFASNVVEKCLEYGDSATLEIIIGEIVGHGDGNDNLLAMVKDQYANYVIQKVIQTCSGDQRELLLSRIRIHLNSLKKYTYGKHIVARFEQLYGEEDSRHEEHYNSFTE